MATPAEVESLPEIRVADAGGIPCFWVESQAPTAAGLVVRAGIADETLVARGVTHLIEHAALPSRRIPGVHFNGLVDTLATRFWAVGDPLAAVEVIKACSASFAALDRSRIRRERGILRAEASQRGVHPVSLAAMLRFGAVAHGLPGFDEYGLRMLSDEDVVEWARSRFTRANCVLCSTEEPPPDLELGLAEGPANPLVDIEELSYVGYPSVYGHGAAGGVTASLLCDRSYAIATAVRLVEQHLRQRLRFQDGSTYSVELFYDPLSLDKVHVVFMADCEPHRSTDTRNNLLATLDTFAESGPSEEDLATYNDEVDRHDDDPNALLGTLFYCAQERLLGGPFRTSAEYAQGRREVTAEAAARAFAEAMESLLLIVPDGSPLPAGRFARYPLDSPSPPHGKRHRRRRPRPWKQRPGTESLLASEQGVTMRHDHVWGVRLSECVAVLRWENGERGLWGKDGFYIHVDPRIWGRGEAIVELLDRHTPAELVVEMRAEPAALDDSDLDAGRQALATRRYEDAVRHLEAGLVRQPGHQRGWKLLAAAAAGFAWPSRSLQAADRAIELDPSDAEAHEHRARALKQLGRRHEAADAVDKALALDPTAINTLASAAWLLSDFGEHERADKIANRAIELHPKNGSAWFARGWSAQCANRLEEAESALERAVELNGGEPAWHNNLGWVVMRSGRHREAIKHFERALKLAPRHTARWNIPLAHALNGNLRQARKLWREQHEIELKHQAALADIDPEDASTRREMAYRLAMLRHYDESLEEARRAHKHAPNDPDVLGQLAVSALEAGRDEEALGRLRELAAQSDVPPETLIVQAWLGALLKESGIAREAADRTADARVPRTQLLTEGYAAAATDNWQTAAEKFEQVAAQHPYNCCAATWRGLAAAAQGDVDSARAFLNTAETYFDCNCLARRKLKAAAE